MPFLTYSLPRQERLKSKINIENLFKKGHFINLYPLRIVYLPSNSLAIDKHQVLFSIPKQKVRHAVLRNRLKRMLRETYRLHKHILYSVTHSKKIPTTYLIAFIYVGHSEDYNTTRLQETLVHAFKNLGTQMKVNNMAR